MTTTKSTKKLVKEALGAIFRFGVVEVDHQSNHCAGQIYSGPQLGFVNPLDLLDTLEFEDQFVFDYGGSPMTVAVVALSSQAQSDEKPLHGIRIRSSPEIDVCGGPACGKYCVAARPSTAVQLPRFRS